MKYMLDLFVGSHNADVVETGVFSDVRITVPFKGEADNRTPMTLGSNLEILEVATGKREIIYSVPNSIQAQTGQMTGRPLFTMAVTDWYIHLI